MKDPRQRALALLVAGAFFMEFLDGTILATAAPTMASALGVTPGEIGIAITAYLVAVAALIPLSGWLVDRFGGRTVFVSAIVCFTMASALCAAATSLPWLIAFRVVQGAAGALMVPVGRLVVMRSTQRDEVIKAVAYLTWPALFAPVLAPVLGGSLSQYASWRWIFLINVPLGLVAVPFALRLVPDERRGQRKPFDWPGFVITALCLASVTYAGSLLAERDVRWEAAVLWFVCGAVALAIGVRHLTSAHHPLMSVTAMHIRTFRVSNAGGTVFRMAVSTVPFLLPLMFQEAFGWSPSRAGAMVVAVFVGNIAIKPVTTPLLRRMGFRRVLLLANAGAGLSIAACALVTPHTPAAVIAALLAVGGAFRSTGFTAYNTLAFADLDADLMTDANTLASTLQQLALGLGVTAGAVALRAGQAAYPSSLGSAYSAAFVVVALLFVVPLVESVRLPRNAGSGIGGGQSLASEQEED